MAGKLSIIGVLSLVFVVCSCNPECVCPPGCTRCTHCRCGSCPSARRFVLSVILPEGATAESYHVDYGRQRKDFYGSTTILYTNENVLDILVYNNDGETVVIEPGDFATTHPTMESDTIHHIPNAFYAKAEQNISIIGDTIKVFLEPQTFNYDVEVEFIDNDGRVTGCDAIILGGMSAGISLLDMECYGKTSHIAATTLANDRINAAIRSWGTSAGRQTLTLMLRRSDGKPYPYYLHDISRHFEGKEKGGRIHIVLDVAAAIPEPEWQGGGIGIGLAPWSENDSTAITIF